MIEFIIVLIFALVLCIAIEVFLDIEISYVFMVIILYLIVNMGSCDSELDVDISLQNEDISSVQGKIDQAADILNKALEQAKKHQEETPTEIFDRAEKGVKSKKQLAEEAVKEAEKLVEEAKFKAESDKQLKSGMYSTTNEEERWNDEPFDYSKR